MASTLALLSHGIAVQTSIGGGGAAVVVHSPTAPTAPAAQIQQEQQAKQQQQQQQQQQQPSTSHAAGEVLTGVPVRAVCWLPCKA
jgi:hypothetical protein